ncbi:hypothetical protein GOODEAATRI_032044, partial [Goodea atripinnis]
VCDVLVENFLPGKLPQMGLGYAELSRVNPRLIYCSISGYGQTGPQAQSPGYDSIASGVSGMMHITGPEDGEPVRPGVAMTDLATGLYAHGAIMAALLQRLTTGRGVHIDCNLLSSQTSVTEATGQFPGICVSVNKPMMGSVREKSSCCCSSMSCFSVVFMACRCTISFHPDAFLISLKASQTRTQTGPDMLLDSGVCWICGVRTPYVC